MIINGNDIVNISVSHPVLGPLSFGKITHLEFGENGLKPSTANFKPLVTSWSGSAEIKLSKKDLKKLKAFMRTPKPRLPRKLKKLIKTDIHIFFDRERKQSIYELLFWANRFKGKIKAHVNKNRYTKPPIKNLP